MKLQLNDSKNYFIEYWKDSFNGISSRRSLFKTFNPRVVISELLDEITLNKQRNISNENFFRNTLGDYLKNDPGINSKIKIHINNIIKEFDTAVHRPSYFISLCELSIKSFDDFDYFGSCINSLLLILDNDLSDYGKEKIHTLTNNLIVEFRLSGYSDEEIYKFLDNVLSTPIQYNETAIWKYPYTEYLKKNNKSIDHSFEYLSHLSNSLEFDDRVNSLKLYYNKQRENFTYIFRLYGVKNADLKLMNVTYYCPGKNKISAEQSPRDEINFIKSDEGLEVVNIAVDVEAISIPAGEREARLKASKSLDIFQRAFRPSTAISISKSMLTLNENKEIVSSSWSIKDNNPNESHKFIDFDRAPEGYENKDLKKIEETLLLAQNNGWGNKFLEICHWLRKAEESNSEAEKLLYYWITIESFCSKSEKDKSNWFETRKNETETDIYIVKEILSKLVAVNSAFDLGWSIYNRLDQSQVFNDIKISDELSKKCQLNSAKEDDIYLVNLVNNCENLEKEISNIYIKNQIEFLRKFYSDSSCALEYLKTNKNNIENEIILLYRMRNKIAHDGSNNHVLLESLTDIARKYALALFSHVVKSIKKTNGKLNFALINAVHSYKIIEERLKEKENPMDVFLPKNKLS